MKIKLSQEVCGGFPRGEEITCKQEENIHSERNRRLTRTQEDSLHISRIQTQPVWKTT